MKITATTTFLYTPKWNDNRSLPKSEQVSVNLKMPTIAEAEALQHIDYRTDGGIRIKYETKRVLEEHVGAIENLTVILDGVTVEIETGIQLAAAKVTSLSKLAQEIVAQVLNGDQLSSEDQKN